jgi:hypothetical protein
VQRLDYVLIAPGRAQARDRLVNGSGALELHQLATGSVRRCELPSRALIGKVG